MDETKTGFCSSCGHEVKIEDQFCNNCGIAVKEIEIEDQPKKEPELLKLASSNDVVVQRTTTRLQQETIRSKKRIILGIIGFIFTIIATITFVIPCFYVNLFGYGFALISTIICVVALIKDKQVILPIICILINTTFSILSVLARTVWDMGYINF
ncbi:MAG: zinc ribbon domain-containing protein [Asgard group archaeon]|nr:zinc ribbon domain-containing protein [Asgard group archaeon]